MVVGFAEKGAELVEPHLLRAPADPVRGFPNVGVAVGGVEPGYCMMALGGRQSRYKRVAKIVNAVLQRGDRILGRRQRLIAVRLGAAPNHMWYWRPW